MANKHPRPEDQPAKLQDDLERNPGIGRSKGLFARQPGKDAGLIEGDSTVEGDTDNDAGRAGGINTASGRTND